jgi:5'-nucleotidase
VLLRRTVDAVSRILVTNDDGVASAGLGILAARLSAAGHDVVVAAPANESSGSAAAIGAILEGDEINTRLVELPDAPGLAAYAVDGPPGRCVLAAVLRAFGPPPDLVVSGINPGANTGRFLQLHSGTLGAALTAGGLGRSAMAVSMGPLTPQHWATAAEVAARLLPYLTSCARGTVINVNVPDLPVESLRELRVPTVGSAVSRKLRIQGTAPGKLYFTWTVNADAVVSEGSDSALVDAGHVTLTAVIGPASVTPHPFGEHLPDWVP